jgi:hypothetical protein
MSTNIAVEENSQTKAKRVCSRCESTETRIGLRKRQDGSILREYPMWYRDKEKGGFMCHRCYDKFMHHPKSNPIYNPINNKRLLTFKGKLIYVSHAPRIGVCNWCRAVVGEINAQIGRICKKTDIHHESYDEKDPLAHTIEGCAHCHGKLNGRGHKAY